MDIIQKRDWTECDFISTFPSRNKDSHKHKHGHLGVVAGSAGMWGASILVMRSALRMGLGFCHYLYTQDAPEVLLHLPEVVHEKFSTQIDFLKFQSFVLGPG